MNSKINEPNQEPDESIFYRLGRAAWEVYRIFQHPGVRMTRRVLKLLETPKEPVSFHRLFEQTTRYSDRELLALFEWFSYDITGSTIFFRFPWQRSTGEVDLKTGRIHIHVWKEEHEYQLGHIGRRLSPNFFAHLSSSQREKYTLFRKSDPVEWDSLVPFSVDDDASYDLAHREYLIALGVLWPIPHPEHIRLLSIFVTQLPKHLQEIVLRNKESFIYEQLIWLQYQSLLTDPWKHRMSRDEMTWLQASPRFLAERLYSRR